MILAPPPVILMLLPVDVNKVKVVGTHDANNVEKAPVNWDVSARVPDNAGKAIAVPAPLVNTAVPPTVTVPANNAFPLLSSKVLCNVPANPAAYAYNAELLNTVFALVVNIPVTANVPPIVSFPDTANDVTDAGNVLLFSVVVVTNVPPPALIDPRTVRLPSTISLPSTVRFLAIVVFPVTVRLPLTVLGELVLGMNT